MPFSFFLVTETSFHASYLITKWVEHFGDIPGFKGIIICEKLLSNDDRCARERFHQEFKGQKLLTEMNLMRLQVMYPNLSETERAMIQLFGIPAHSTTYHPGTIFLGENLNSSLAKQWLIDMCSATNKPFFFIFLDQLLASWWIELTDSQIINGHSAVLPYARGMFAIENIAITQDIDYFKRSAGATIHYIDTGVDTGPIIRAERLREPFCFDSIWQLKSYTFITLFDLLLRVATDMSKGQDTIPVGVSPDPVLRGPNFRRKYFTLEARRKTEESYLKMKAQASLL